MPGHTSTDNSEDTVIKDSKENLTEQTSTNDSENTFTKDSEANLSGQTSTNDSEDTVTIDVDFMDEVDTNISDVQFIEPVPENSKCFVCNEVFSYPMQTKCGHRFCSPCIKGGNERNNEKCPKCQKDIQQLWPDAAKHREIIELQVKCTNNDVCGWTGKLIDLKMHKEDCQYEKVFCSNENCEEMIQRINLKIHINDECKYALKECQWCSEYYQHLNKQVHEQSCLELPMNCTNDCGEYDIARKNMGRHLSESCEKEIHTCEFQPIGCDFQGTRKSLAEHQLSDRYHHIHLEHFASLDKHIRDVESEINTIKQSEKELSREAEQAKDNCARNFQDLCQQLTDEKTEAKRMLEDIERQGEMLKDQGELISTQRDIIEAIKEEISQKLDEQQKRFEDQNEQMKNDHVQKFDDFSQSLMNGKDEMKKMREDMLIKMEENSREMLKQGIEFKEEQAKRIVEQKSQLDEQYKNISQMFCHQSLRLDRQRYEIDELKENDDLLSDELDKMFSEITLLEPRYNMLPNRSLLFVINDFRENFKKSKQEGNLIYSDPFYCGRGYRALICVFLNGWAEGSDTHISCYFEVLKGPFDDALDWPLQLAIEFSIEAKNDQQFRCGFDTSNLLEEDLQKHFGKPAEDANVVWGFSCFMDHKDIENYLKDDAMNIAVNISFSKQWRSKNTITQIRKHQSQIKSLKLV